jgi:bifunctional ADP-heptose synthase (sugar kinase/adenylyltransferase)/phosphoglycolate phosphatase-like HAD superfamily hydrolase
MGMRILDIFEDARRLSVGIIGDLCVDAYYFVHEEPGAISIETGKPTCSVEKYRFDLGGAANVALNLKTLGVGRVEVFGVIGDDPFGGVLSGLLEKAGAANKTVVQREQWSTHVYSKIYRAGVEEPRLDIGNFNVPSEASINALIDSLERSLPGLDAVIINEQVQSGFHITPFQEKLQKLIDNNSRPIWLCDCRSLNDAYAHTIRKLNDREAEQLYNAHNGGRSPAEEAEGGNRLAAVIVWLYEHWGRPVVITRGADGAMAYNGETVQEIPGLHIINKIDTVGAGDAFLAALSLGLAEGLPLRDSMELGNFSAGVSVQKLFQTGHPRPSEIAAIGESPDYRYNVDLAENPRRAHYIPDTEIEIIARPAPGTPKIAIFDHDGTISTLRLGWETVMEDTMLRCIAGGAYATISPTRFGSIQQEVRDFISRTTGVQTLVQMEGLRAMVQEAGFVPAAEIRTAAEYKKLYNNRLIAMVEQRVRRLNGQFTADDFTIKGAIPFLKRLHEAGVELYLASGTDAEDVRREAELLGYGGLFARIYGSVGDVAKEPKKEVFKKIMADIGETPVRECRCVVFGDGPVELREARKNGAAAVGLTSNEEQRFGINHRKRSRLILAGADVLIPDFTWAGEMLAWLGWKL